MFGLKQIKQDIAKLKAKVKELECDHPISSRVFWVRNFFSERYYKERCGECEKLFQEHSEASFKKAKAKNLRAQAKALESKAC